MKNANGKEVQEMEKMNLDEIISQRVSSADTIKAALEAAMVDEEILDYLIQINNFDGVITSTSCAGHTLRELEKAGPERIGATLHPYLGLKFNSTRLLALFCYEVARLDDKSKISLDLYPTGRSVTIKPAGNSFKIRYRDFGFIPEITDENLPEMRSAMFNQVIELLSIITNKASFHELSLKATALGRTSN